MILSEKTVRIIKEKASKYPKRKGAILPSLTLAYKQLGYVDNEVYEQISEILNVSQLEIAGVCSTTEAKRMRDLFASLRTIGTSKSWALMAMLPEFSNRTVIDSTRCIFSF